MRKVFADTQFLVALINKGDQGHQKARAIKQSLQGVSLVTTDEVLIEVLTFFSKRGRFLRQLAVVTVDDLLVDPDVVVAAQSRASFLAGFALYKARPDKGYSLTDSTSMATMRREGITDVLTHDGHFAQEGFRLLL